MSNRTDIVVETDNAEGQVLLSASRVYDLTEDKTQDTINSEVGSSLTSLGNTLNSTQSGLAYIVGNTNTTGSQLAVGTYVYIKGHSTIPEGLRAVNSNGPIATNGSITTSNTDAVSKGGLNNLLDYVINATTRDAIRDKSYRGYSGAYNLDSVADGIYYCTSSSTNTPETYFLVVQWSADDYKLQIGMAVSNPVKLYARRYNNGWSVWRYATLTSAS